MRWYTGGIAEAVASSKSRNAIFVVYIEGTDSNSMKLTSLVNDPEVSSKLESDDFVALKLEANSIPHRQFAEIYKNVSVPSIFFIGRTGQPLDIITNVADNQELLVRINKVIFTHTGANPNSAASQSSAFIQSEQKVESVASSNVSTAEPKEDSPEPTNTSENGVCNNYVEEEKIDLQNDASELSKEEKIQKARELIEKKREAKEQEEKETEKQKEIERRKLGQEVLKMKRWQQDQELKELMEKRKKEKSEDKAARDRILAQIAQDKADRAARFGTAPPAPAPSSPTTSDPVKPIPSLTSGSARLQFRLPDGSTNTSTFEDQTTLQEIRNYIRENMNLPFRNFAMSTTFPRREFTSENDKQTLRELELCPTAVILIVPMQFVVPLSNQGGGLMGFFMLLLAPIFSIYGYIRSWFSRGNVAAAPSNEPNERNKRNSGENYDNQQPNNKRRSTESTTVRRQGNIHRFTDRSDSDDENNTWNGNSTQQM